MVKVPIDLPFEYKLDHIGIAVKSLQEGFAFYKALGWAELDIEEVPSEKVKVGMIELANDCRIELLESTDPDGPIARFLNKRGPGIHHICLRVDDIEGCLALLKEKKVELVNDEPRAGAHGCRVAFVHPRSAGGVLLELSQKD